jgi:hypothetical protein
VSVALQPPGLGRDEVDYTDEDAYLLNKDREIRELKAALGASPQVVAR